jgi:hypothetical protein
LNLASSAPGLMSRSLARRGGGELPPLTPDDERAALDAALMGVTGPVGRVGGKAWRWLSQTPGLTRSVPGGWRTFAGGPVHGAPAAPVSGRRGKAEKLHDLASDPRTPAHEAAAARSAYENLTGESLSPPSGRASMRAAYEARAPKPGRVGVREAHAKARPELVATSEEIPLGLSRPPVRDVSLEGMADDAFGEHWKNINRHLSGLERRFDEDLALERDPAFRRELAEAQDEWVAADMERFRRDIGRIHPESIFNRLLELRPNSAEDRMKMQIVVEEMAADPDPNVLRQLEAEFVRYGEQSASHAEVAKRILEDIKNVRPAPASAPSTGRSALRAAYEGGQRPGSRLLTSPDDWTPDLSSWSPEIAAEVSRMVPREAQGLFHVTTNYGGVRKSSLKSGDDVPGSVGLGSAGAGKGRVSVTYDRRKAELIRDGLRLAGSIGRGESTAADVLAFFEGAHGLRLASDGYRTNRFGEGVFSPVGRLLSGKASSTVESLLPHLSPETKGWVEGGFQPVGNWDAEAMYDEIRTAASIVYDTPQKQAHLFKELDTSFWHGSPLPSSERPKLLLFGDAKSWSRIDPADVQILDLDVRRGALPEGGQDRSLSTWGREREFKASDFVIPGEQEMRFNPEDIRVRWDDMPAPAPATGRSALRAAYEAGKPEPVAPEPQTPAGKWALRPDVDPDDAQRLIPRSVSARLWKGTDRTIPDHVLMHYEKEIQHTLDGWIDEFMQTQAGALQDDRWDTPLPTLGPDEAWSEAVKDPKFRSLLETRDRIAAKIESLHSSPPPPTQTPAQTGEIPARDALIKTAERVCGEIGYMNCKLFVQGVSDVSRLETLPSRQYSSVPDLSPGEIIEWGDGLHYAIYLGDNEIMHVEEWGAPMSRSSIHDLEGGGVRVGDQVEDPPSAVMTPAAHPPSPPPPTQTPDKD